MKVRLGKEKVNSLRILLNPGASSSIIIGKHTNKLRNKNTKHIHWSTKGGDFNINYTSKVEIAPTFFLLLNLQILVIC